MKKTISIVLTAAIMFGSASVAYAKPKEGSPVLSKKPSFTDTKNKDNKSDSSYKDKNNKVEIKLLNNSNKNNKSNDKNKENNGKKNNDKKNNALEKTKEALIKSCDKMIEQVNKLKGYIISADGHFLVEFKDQKTGDAALKSIEDTIAKIEGYKEKISKAETSKDLKDLSKEIKNNLFKHQAIVKKITGLTSAARLKLAYDNTKALAEKIGTGIEGIKKVGAKVDVSYLEKSYQGIQASLEEARLDYLDAVAMYSSMNDISKNDKSFKAAHAKLMEAKKELHDALIQIKKLLVKIKTSIHIPDVGLVDRDADDDRDVDEK